MLAHLYSYELEAETLCSKTTNSILFCTYWSTQQKIFVADCIAFILINYVHIFGSRYDMLTRELLTTSTVDVMKYFNNVFNPNADSFNTIYK